jgi:hypothetical protein
LKKYFIYSILVLFLSCGDDEDSQEIQEQDQEELLLSNFSIISFDDEAFYEYRFNEGTQQALSFNLTEQQAIERQVFFVHRNESVFGFYNQGNAFVKDFSTDQLFFVDDFGGQPGEERLTARNDKETLGIVYGFPNSTEFFLRVIDISSSNRFNISLGELSVNTKLYVQGDAIFVIDNQGADSTLLKIDKNTQNITSSLDVGENLSGIVFGDDQNIFVFNFSGEFKQYAIDNLELINEGTSSFIPNDSFTFKYRNGVIYSQFEYSQPSFYAIGPEAYNLITGEEARIDIESIFNNYIANASDTSEMQPVHFDYDVSNDVWIVAFAAQNQEGEERFGYFVIDTDGEILRETPLDRAPWTVIVYN